MMIEKLRHQLQLIEEYITEMEDVLQTIGRQSDLMMERIHAAISSEHVSCD